jgi:hypothetical protein
VTSLRLEQTDVLQLHDRVHRSAWRDERRIVHDFSNGIDVMRATGPKKTGHPRRAVLLTRGKVEKKQFPVGWTKKTSSKALFGRQYENK